MKKYSLKISIAKIITILPIFISTAIIFITKISWTGVLFLGIISLLVFLDFTTCYIIKDKRLIIKYNIFLKKTIEIAEIYKVCKNNSTSKMKLDTVEIFYKKFDSVAVFPKEKENFIEELLKINPNIQIKEID